MTNPNLHILMTIPSEPGPQACIQACSLLKLSLCHQSSVCDAYVTKSFLQQPSLHVISILISLLCRVMVMNPEPALQAWFNPPILHSLSHGKEKNTFKFHGIQKGLHAISILMILFLFMNQTSSLKLAMIDLTDQPHYFTYPINQGYPPSNLQCSIFTGMVASVLLVQIIGNSIPFVHTSATAANSHANQDPCVHF